MMGVDREVIEEQLDEIVPAFLDSFEGKQIIPGWRVLLMLDLHYHENGPLRVPYLEGEQLKKLLALVEVSPDAFDAAGYLAGFALAAGFPLAPELNQFAAEVLAGERNRPNRRGRPLSDGKLIAIYKIALVYFLHEKAGVPISRNRENSGESQYNACEAVAAAFSRAGNHTTFTQVASLVYDEAHASLRAAARALGYLEVPDKK